MSLQSHTFQMALWRDSELKRRSPLFGLAPRKAFLVRSSVYLGAISVVTALGLLWSFNLSTVSLLYLFIVVMVAIEGGFWHATVISLLAAGCQCFIFAPPAFSLSIADPQNAVSIATFEMCALVVSRLADRERRQAHQTLLQRTGKEQLYEMSQAALTVDLFLAPAPQIVRMIRRIFRVHAVAIIEDERTLACEGDWPGAELCRAADVHERPLPLAGTGSFSPAGSTLLIRGELDPLTLDALTALVASTLDRHRAFQSEGRVAAAHQAEQLRTAVLDSLAHAFKTPLTAMRVASSGLIALAGLPPAQAEMVALLDEQVSVLNGLATRLLETARLDPAHIGIDDEEILLGDLIRQSVARHAPAERTLVLSIADETLATRGDSELLALVVGQYVENAAKYSFQGTPIRVDCRPAGSEILLSVHNQGPTIALADRERIFDRFYRCPSTRHMASGTGLGLAVAKKAAEAHGGHAWVISEEGSGTTFFLSLRGHAPMRVAGVA